jgi:hypothetical protein
MNIFKKNTVETSDDYYEAYKAEMVGENEKKNFFSLSNILKLEVLVVAVGILILNQNSLSLEFKKTYVAGNNVLPVSIQQDSRDNDLIVALEDAYVEKIIIKEDNPTAMLTEKVLDKELYVENSDIKLLIELLQSEMKENKQSKSSNRIIISQK